MIYFDNGATTFPKPENVIRTVNNTLRFFGANPGRGGHRLGIKASELVYNTREIVSNFFGCDNPENVIFTLNCTMALNIVIKGVLNKGDHVIISSYEHNAVVRPLEKLKKIGVSYSVVEINEKDNDKTIDNFRKAIRENTKLMVCTHASNVFGIKLPVERICALCHQYGILCCVDAAQSAGLLPINLATSSIDYLCLAGHKGLYGPMGVGVLIINCDTIPESLCEGGTGSNSINYHQPEILPDKFESGTGNISGIVGLGEGIKFVNKYGTESILKKEISLMSYLYSELNKLNKVILYTSKPEYGVTAPLLSFNIKEQHSDNISEILSEKFNIAVRSGLHCAPLAHKTKNTLNVGTVRVVPSVFTNKSQIDRLLYAIVNI